MCNRNGQEWYEATIKCNPEDGAIQWKVMARHKKAKMFHGCHAQFAHPLEGGWACREAARQINKAKNAADKIDYWMIFEA